MRIFTARAEVGFPLSSTRVMRDVSASHGSIAAGLPLATAPGGALHTHERPPPRFWLMQLLQSFFTIAPVAPDGFPAAIRSRKGARRGGNRAVQWSGTAKGNGTVKERLMSAQREARGGEWYTQLAHYNRWVNEKLYEACAGFSDAQRKRDLNAFFHSVHGTLNHLLLADRVWLRRLTGTPFAVASLREELYADFDALRAARADTDRAILAYVDGLSAARLQAPLTYRSLVRARWLTYPLATVLLHFFNHQTHHRGQVTALIQQLGGDYGDIDLLRIPGLPG